MKPGRIRTLTLQIGAFSDEWRPDSTLPGETWFFLKHTPDTPMPDCP